MKSSKKAGNYTNNIEHSYKIISDICVCCGEPVPEGRMICWKCEHQYDKNSGSGQKYPMLRKILRGRSK